MSQITPALSGNPIVELIVFGIFVALVETVFFVLLVNLGLTMLNVSYTGNIAKDLTNKKIWMVGIAVGAAAALFHLTAKGIAAVLPLIVTGFFFLLTALMPSIQPGRMKEMEGPVWMHIINNTLTMLSQLGVF